jgi:biopolymer transport protein ExbD
MVVTPMLDKRLGVLLPETANPGSMPELRSQLKISIRSDGNVFVDDNWVPRERLAATLKTSYGLAPSRPIVVDGDRRLRYREVASVLRIVRDAGFERVGLATRRRNAD